MTQSKAPKTFEEFQAILNKARDAEKAAGHEIKDPAYNTPEMDRTLWDVERLTSELSNKLVDAIMPVEPIKTENVPGAREVQDRLVEFGNRLIQVTLNRATERVQKHWPDMMMSPEDEEKLMESEARKRDALNNLMEAIINGPPPQGVDEVLPQPGGLDPKKLN